MWGVQFGPSLLEVDLLHTVAVYLVIVLCLVPNKPNPRNTFPLFHTFSLFLLLLPATLTAGQITAHFMGKLIVSLLLVGIATGEFLVSNVPTRLEQFLCLL